MADSFRETFHWRSNPQSCDSFWPKRVVDVSPLQEALATIFQDADDDLAEEIIMLHGDAKRIVPPEETKARLARIAKKLENRGVEKDKVCTEMCRLRSNGTKLIPYDESYVRRLLPAEYKMTAKARCQESALLVAQIPDKPDAGEVWQKATLFSILNCATFFW